MNNQTVIHFQSGTMQISKIKSLRSYIACYIADKTTTEI